MENYFLIKHSFVMIIRFKFQDFLLFSLGLIFCLKRLFLRENLRRLFPSLYDFSLQHWFFKEKIILIYSFIMIKRYLSYFKLNPKITVFLIIIMLLVIITVLALTFAAPYFILLPQLSIVEYLSLAYHCFNNYFLHFLLLCFNCFTQFAALSLK